MEKGNNSTGENLKKGDMGLESLTSFGFANFRFVIAWE